MSWTLKAHTLIGGASGGTTPSINTTGADLIVIGLGWYSTGPATISDSQSNTWSYTTTYNDAAVEYTRIAYCQAPSVSSAHTFTLAGGTLYQSCWVAAFSGSGSLPLDQVNGAGANATSVQTGSITPGVNGELLFSALGQGGSNTSVVNAIDSSFTITDQYYPGQAGSAGGGAAYLFQTTAGVVNPTWSWFASGFGTNAAATVASFKPASGGGTNVALTGQSATTGEGSLSLASSAALSGQSATSSEGTLVPASDVSLSGQSATVSEGALGLAADVTLSGQASTVGQGTLGTSGGTVNVALTGQYVTVYQGVISGPAPIPPAYSIPGGKGESADNEELMRFFAQQAAEARAFERDEQDVQDALRVMISFIEERRL